VLNDREKRFCEEYAISGKGKDAAIKAGYSVKNAYNTSSLLLKKSKIIKYLGDLKKPQDDERQTYIDIINNNRKKAANKLVELIDCANPVVAKSACESILQLDKTLIKPTDDKPKTVTVEFV
jgi:hypothetical protein